jgi:DNA end-binding protein Ku
LLFRATGNPQNVPRAIWSGSIAFGLVNAPVRLYSAIAEHKISFHLVHTKDGSRIGYQKVCKKEDKPVPDDEVAKGYESNGKVILLEPEDFAAAQGEGTKTIEVLDFVPHEQIDPIYYERTFYLGPEKGAEKVYRLLVEAMERAGLVAVVRLYFREREQLACLRVRDGVLLLEKMYYEDEIRPADDLAPSRRSKVDEQELDLALTLIERFTRDFEPSKYEDTYRDRLLKVIQQKKRGKTIEAPQVEEKSDEAPDLLAALRESVERARGGNGRRQARGNGAGLEGMTVAELGKRAAKLGIEGRSKMSKRALVSAIEKAET